MINIKKLYEKVSPYRKTIVSLIVAILQFGALLVSLLSDGILDTNDIIALINSAIIGLGGTATVYGVSNKPRTKG